MAAAQLVRRVLADDARGPLRVVLGVGLPAWRLEGRREPVPVEGLGAVVVLFHPGAVPADWLAEGLVGNVLIARGTFLAHRLLVENDEFVLESESSCMRRPGRLPEEGVRALHA